MPGILIWIIVVVVVLVIAAALYIANRFRTVEEGYVDVLQQFDKMSRCVDPGPYWLRPFEEKVRSIFVRQREVTGLEIPGIFTHGGTSVTVLLDYEMKLDPTKMSKDELYYDEISRDDQQRRIIKGILQEIVREIPAPPPQPDQSRTDTNRLFSPFSSKSVEVRQKLEAKASQQLAQHGIVIGQGSLLIGRLNLHPKILEAIIEAQTKGFTSASEKEMIERIRAAGVGMSDAGLVQLVHAIRNHDSGMNTIIAGGGFVPGMHLNTGPISTPLTNATPPPTAQPAPTPPQTTDPAQPSTPPGADSTKPTPQGDDLPLTPEVMLTLHRVDD